MRGPSKPDRPILVTPPAPRHPGLEDLCLRPIGIGSSASRRTPRMKKLLLIAALTAFTLPALAADPLPRAAPESVGLSPERLARLGAMVDTEVREGRMPGAVIAIARHGKLAYYEAHGFQDG